MGLIVEKTDGIRCVGQLIEALQAFPEDMPIEVGMSSVASVFRVKPQPGESVESPRGRVCIQDDDDI